MVPAQASAPQPTHASAETASARAVIRRVARTLRRQRSGGGASPSCATRRSTTRLRIPTAASAATSVNASRPTPAQRYQSRKPSTIAVTAASRAAGPRSASNTAAAAALRCTGPIVSWGRSGPQTVSGRRSIAVFPTCSSRAGPSGESCTGPRAHGDDLPERHDVAARRERDRGRYAHEQAERHERDGRPLAQGGPAPASVVQGGPPPAGRTGVPSMRRACCGRKGRRATAIPGAPAPPAARRRRSRDPARTARRRRVRPRRPGGRACPPCAPRAPAAVPARTAPCRGGAR